MNKICSSCKQEKQLTEFRDHPLGKLGKHSVCKDCQRNYAKNRMKLLRETQPEKVKATKKSSYENRKDFILEKSKKYYQSIKDFALEKARIYRETNREKIRANQREYYKKNKEVILQKDKIYKAKNSETVKQRVKTYREEHKAEIRQRNRARKLSLKFSNRGYKQVDWDKCLAFWGNVCAVCGRAEGDGRIISADHWIPLSKGGITHKSNIIPLCHGVDGCNNKKKDKEPLEWIVSFMGKEKGEEKYKRITDYLHG